MTRTLINVDLSQAELRVMAILSGDKWMQKALAEGAGDFFDNHLMPVAFPDKLAKYGDVFRWKDHDANDHKECRTQVKGVVYGLSFGRQAPAIGRELKMPGWKAQNIIDNFLGKAYDLDKWREQVQEAARVPSKREFLTNPFGRKFQSEIVTTKNFHNIQREALAFLPQSTSSDIMLSTVIRINPAIKEFGYKTINLVHDAVMIEGDEEHAELVASFVMKELRRTGEAVLGDSVPFLSDWSHGKSWADLS